MRFDSRLADRWLNWCHYRFLRPPSWWHNRQYLASQTLHCGPEDGPDGGSGGNSDRGVASWSGVGTVELMELSSLPIFGDTSRVVASGPSLADIHSPGRMFSRPVACVNGGCVLAQRCDATFEYYIVTDANFVSQQPDLFRMGVRRAAHLIFNPMVLFATMRLLPGLLSDRPVFLKRDLKRPFKAPAQSLRRLRRLDGVIAHPRRKMVFCTRPSRGTYPSGTVVGDAVQILLGRGYQRLELYGMDLGGDRRFYDEVEPSPSHLADAYEARIRPMFELVREHCDATGQQVLNASPRSRLPAEVLPKFDPNELLQNAARSAA